MANHFYPELFQDFSYYLMCMGTFAILGLILGAIFSYFMTVKVLDFIIAGAAVGLISSTVQPMGGGK